MAAFVCPEVCKHLFFVYMSPNALFTLCTDVQVPKPKLEMAVPYKEYKLVHSDGSIPERTKKHPFCMSRVHYSETGQILPYYYTRFLNAARNVVVVVVCCARLFTWQQHPSKSTLACVTKSTILACCCWIHLHCTPCSIHRWAQRWVLSACTEPRFAVSAQWHMLMKGPVCSLCCDVVQRGGRRYGPSWQMAPADGGRPAQPSHCCASKSLLALQLSTCTSLWSPTASEVPRETSCIANALFFCMPT